MKIKKIGILKEKHVSEQTKIETLKETGLQCCCSDLSRIMGVDYDSATGYGDYWYNGLSHDTKKKTPMKYITKGDI